MTSNNSGLISRIGVAEILFIVLLVLKLTNIIAWSWWWVTAPLWGGLAFTIVLAAAFLFVSEVKKAVRRLKR